MSNLRNEEPLNRKFNTTGKLLRLLNKKKKNRKKFRFFAEFQHFCRNTSLHGFRHITSDENCTIEKFIWSFICATYVLVVITMIVIIWNRFSKTPTATTIDTTTFPIWELPFPAITICNHNKVYLPTAIEIAKSMLESGYKQQDVDRLFDLLPKLIRPEFGNGNFTYIPDVLEALGVPTEPLMLNLMQPCKKMLRSCGWLDQWYDCSKIFKTIKTSEGFCCSFNYHAKDKPLSFETETDNTNFNLENPGKGELPGVDKIQTVPGAGRDFGLMVNLDIEKKYYRGSTRPYAGASIIIHHPTEYPEVDVRSAIIQPSQEVSILLSGTIIESGPGIRSLPVDSRNCFFEDEKQLKISPVYGYHSCISECRIKFISANCNCVPFYYPRTSDPSTRICGLDDINCIQSIRKNLSELQALNDDKKDLDCKCLPLCTDYWYTLNTESAQIDYNNNNIMLIDGLDMENISTVMIFFRDITCIKYSKSHSRSWDDIVSSLCGIFGLCMGGSLISLIEVVYFLIINTLLRRERQYPPIQPLINKIIIKNAESEKSTTPLYISSVDNLYKSAFIEKNNFFVERKNSEVKTKRTDEILHYFSK